MPQNTVVDEMYITYYNKIRMGCLLIFRVGFDHVWFSNKFSIYTLNFSVNLENWLLGIEKGNGMGLIRKSQQIEARIYIYFLGGKLMVIELK